MPLPKGYLPRKGDTLLICVDVRSDYDNDGSNLVAVAVTGSPRRTLFADLNKIHSIYARKWSEGDRVQNSEGWGDVVAVHEDQVWIKMCSPIDMAGLMITSDSNNLESHEPAVSRDDDRGRASRLVGGPRATA
jgi:hypothetical protein